MAKSAKNIVMHGASGKLGNQIVIRQRGGEAILSQAPGKREGEGNARAKNPAEQVRTGHSLRQSPDRRRRRQG